MAEVQEAGSWTPVCSEPELADDRFREFQLDGRPCFLFRRQGRLYAYQNQCPHLGITLNWTPGRFMDPDNCFIHCANHGALFTPESGTCIAGPCEGDHLAPVALRVSNGIIEASLQDDR